MSSCPSYRYEITEGSPLFPLRTALDPAGITPQDRDQGFHQIDYARPSEWGRIEGAGDCFIDHREDLRTLLNRWRQFRIPLQKWQGRDLTWDLQPIKETELERDREDRSLIRHDAAVETIRIDLEKRGLARNSAAY